MLDDSEPLIALEYAQELGIWTCARYNELITANFVRPPYHTDEKTIKRLQSYIHAGLSPAEAAEVCFGKMH